MIRILYYADAVTNEDGMIEPATTEGHDIPPGCKMHYDRDLQRFVVGVHPSYNFPDPAWVRKTQEEVLADYPEIESQPIWGE